MTLTDQQQVAIVRAIRPLRADEQAAFLGEARGTLRCFGSRCSINCANKSVMVGERPGDQA
jgi:hypothetical protein